MKFRNKITIVSLLFMISILTPQFPISTIYAATIRTVNQTYGPYTTITDALNASNTGDTIEITDSQTYYENFIIGIGGRNIYDLTIKGKDGEQPVISGEGITGSIIQIKNSGCIIKNLTVYVGGASYGIDSSGAGTILEGLSFDNHIAGAGNTFCVGATNNIRIANSNFLGMPSVSGGGIIISSSTSINCQVDKCDFYGTGIVGGMIGMGLASGSTASITSCCFATDNSTNTIIAINSWGSGTIDEYVNTFRNVYGSVNGFNSNIPHSTDVLTNGSVTPSNSGTLMTDTILNSFLSWFGATNEYSWDNPASSTLGNSLNKAVRSEGFDSFDPNYYDSVIGITLKQNTVDFINYVNTKMWFDFSISWGRQFDPSTWYYIKTVANEVRSQTNLADIILQGYCMEAIDKVSINNTIMDKDLWLLIARNFPNDSFRPLEAKIINGRRWQGHWFDYDSMLGYGVNHWGTDVSVPNLNKQEALLYYIYLAKSYIDAGMNDVSFAQPHLTFGQNLNQYDYGGVNLQYVSRFARNYGHYFAIPINGQRYVTCGLSTNYWYLQSYSNYINYTRGPAGVSSNQGNGTTWNYLSDAWNTIPPTDIVIPNKPYICEIDNFGTTNDQISTFAKADSSVRNQFMTDYTAYLLSNRGFYMMQPMLEPIISTGCQNFIGYAVPPQGINPNWNWPWPWFFQPFQEYSGFENTVKSIFDSH